MDSEQPETIRRVIELKKILQDEITTVRQLLKYQLT